MAKRVYALDEAKAKIAELEKQLAEGEALIIELVAALKNQHKPTN